MKKLTILGLMAVMAAQTAMACDGDKKGETSASNDPAFYIPTAADSHVLTGSEKHVVRKPASVETKSETAE